MTSGPRSRSLDCRCCSPRRRRARLRGEGTDRVAALFATLAPPPDGAIPFVEMRMSSLLVEPIEVRGELQLGKDGAIDKQVFEPTAERVRSRRAH